MFGYTDAESTNLVNMAPVVVGERLTASEAQTVAQLFSEYGVQVSIINQEDQYVDLASNECFISDRYWGGEKPAKVAEIKGIQNIYCSAKGHVLQA